MSITMPFFTHIYIVEFDKNANSNYVGMCLITVHKISLATIGVCVFYASASVGAFFIL